MSSETIYSIYLITNLVNNKTYIGWTSRDPYKDTKNTKVPVHQSDKQGLPFHAPLKSMALKILNSPSSINQKTIIIVDR